MILRSMTKKQKRGRYDNGDESEDNKEEDRLSDLPDCVLLSILSFLNAKQVVQTCILSTRWKNLWKCIPALILHYSYSNNFSTRKSFDKFVSRILRLRNDSIVLHTFDFECDGGSIAPQKIRCIELRILRKIVSYILSHTNHLHRLGISLKGDISLILPCVSACRALTSLKLSLYNKGRHNYQKIVFPKSLNLPALTSLDLTNFAFYANDESANHVEPFSAFNNLNSLIISYCTVRGAKILSISSETLVSLSMVRNSPLFTKIKLSTPSLCTLTLIGGTDQKLCGSCLSSVKRVNIDINFVSYPFWEPPVVLCSWFLDLPNITTLTVTSNTLLVLSLKPDFLKLEFPSLCNLKSLKVKMKPFSHSAKILLLEAVMIKDKSWKEASKIRKAFKEGLEPDATMPGRIADFLRQNSPSAQVDFIDDL